MNGPHVPSIVLGLALVAMAGLVGFGLLVGVRLDLGLVVPVLLVGLGGLLLVGGWSPACVARGDHRGGRGMVSAEVS